MNQRGMRKEDIELLLMLGTTIDDDSVLLLDKDVDREIKKLKRKIEILQRMRGSRVVVDDDRVVTTYRPTRKFEKKLLRH
jgi:hypothetical protein